MKVLAKLELNNGNLICTINMKFIRVTAYRMNVCRFAKSKPRGKTYWEKNHEEASVFDEGPSMMKLHKYECKKQIQ